MTATWGLLSDSHFHNWSAFSSLDENGVNSRLQFIVEEFWNCARALSERGGKTIYHGGDLFHVRGSIAPSVMNVLTDAVTDIYKELGVSFVFMPGNHDMEFNDTQKIGYSMGSLGKIEGVEVIDGIEHFHDDNVIMIPWRDSIDDLLVDVDRVIKIIRDEDQRLIHDLIIHAPLNGVISGIPDNGLDAVDVAKWGFRRVFVGHYHRHAEFEGGKVISIGATTHQTFSDIGTQAGFMIIGKDGDQGFFESKAPKFMDYDLAWGAAESELKCKGNYVRIRLGECTEAEIREIRDGVTNMGALGVVVQATPCRDIVQRESSAIESGQTLIQSVASYVEADTKIDNKDEVLEECMLVLDEVRSIA
jgi:hypothetical protein